MKRLFIGTFLIGAIAAFGQDRKKAPKFEDYLSNEMYGEKCPTLRLETEEQRKHSKELRLAEIRLPNFATFYHLIQFQCGEGCERLAVIDGRTGKIHGSPFANQDSQFYIPPSTWDPQQPRGFGRLLQVPNVCPNGPSSCATFYFSWENDAFRLVEKIPVSAVPIVPAKSPFIGTWEGAWSYSTGGVENHSQEFRLTVVEGANGQLSGKYFDKTNSPKSKPSKVKYFEQTKADKSAYRATIEGSCWNFGVTEDDEIQGMWNGGPCNQFGLGSGARLIGFQAKRVAN